jgi:hypothetical protein
MGCGNAAFVWAGRRWELLLFWFRFFDFALGFLLALELVSLVVAVVLVCIPSAACGRGVGQLLQLLGFELAEYIFGSRRCACYASKLKARAPSPQPSPAGGRGGNVSVNVNVKGNINVKDNSNSERRSHRHRHHNQSVRLTVKLPNTGVSFCPSNSRVR